MPAPPAIPFRTRRAVFPVKLDLFNQLGRQNSSWGPGAQGILFPILGADCLFLQAGQTTIALSLPNRSLHTTVQGCAAERANRQIALTIE